MRASEHQRERMPLDWARTQNNLGKALLALGERQSSTAHLEAAGRSFTLALDLVGFAPKKYDLTGIEADLKRARADLTQLRSRSGLAPDK